MGSGALLARGAAGPRWPSATSQLLGIKTPTASTRPSAALAAATSRRCVLARWLATEPRLLILDEPTRGIDVAAKQEIMEQILRARATAAWRCCSSRPS